MHVLDLICRFHQELGFGGLQWCRRHWSHLEDTRLYSERSVSGDQLDSVITRSNCCLAWAETPVALGLSPRVNFFFFVPVLHFLKMLEHVQSLPLLKVREIVSTLLHCVSSLS